MRWRRESVAPASAQTRRPDVMMSEPLRQRALSARCRMLSAARCQDARYAPPLSARKPRVVAARKPRRCCFTRVPLMAAEAQRQQMKMKEASHAARKRSAYARVVTMRYAMPIPAQKADDAPAQSRMANAAAIKDMPAPRAKMRAARCAASSRPLRRCRGEHAEEARAPARCALRAARRRCSAVAARSDAAPRMQMLARQHARYSPTMIAT